MFAKEAEPSRHEQLDLAASVIIRRGCRCVYELFHCFRASLERLKLERALVRFLHWQI
jgi:hypothetical protein